MKVLIVEDEIVASNRLARMLEEIEPPVEVAGRFDSVLDTSNYLMHEKPDLIFLDIHLSDGICFELFENKTIDVPIIFTTAYDEYMERAFKVNSIDYLLKPLEIKDLSNSIEKFRRIKKANHNQDNLLELFKGVLKENKSYKSRFMVKYGRGYVSVKVEDVAYFLAENKLNFLIDHSGKKYLIDHNLDQLMELLNPDDFIKINRNFILSYQCIKKFESYFNNRMMVFIEPTPTEDVIVSRNYLKSFINWMDR